jgi:hypothetical protein
VEEPAPAAEPQPVPEPEPAEETGNATGTISAQPEEGDEIIESAAVVGLLCQYFSGVKVILTDVPGDTADEVCNFQPMDVPAPYHRLAIKIGALPTEPGEHPAVELAYSLHDEQNGPFNYGWSTVEGNLVITEISGVAESDAKGPLTGVSLAGTFEISNNRGGRFTGEFSFSGN